MKTITKTFIACLACLTLFSSCCGNKKSFAGKNSAAKNTSKPKSTIQIETKKELDKVTSFFKEANDAITELKTKLNGYKDLETKKEKALNDGDLDLVSKIEEEIQASGKDTKKHGSKLEIIIDNVSDIVASIEKLGDDKNLKNAADAQPEIEKNKAFTALNDVINNISEFKLVDLEGLTIEESIEKLSSYDEVSVGKNIDTAETFFNKL